MRAQLEVDLDAEAALQLRDGHLDVHLALGRRAAVRASAGRAVPDRRSSSMMRCSAELIFSSSPRALGYLLNKRETSPRPAATRRRSARAAPHHEEDTDDRYSSDPRTAANCCSPPGQMHIEVTVAKAEAPLRRRGHLKLAAIPTRDIHGVDRGTAGSKKADGARPSSETARCKDEPLPARNRISSSSTRSSVGSNSQHSPGSRRAIQETRGPGYLAGTVVDFASRCSTGVPPRRFERAAAFKDGRASRSRTR